MAALVRKLSNGEVAIFDKSKRELILVSADAARGKKELDLKIGKELVKEGKAKQFSRDDLAAISQALSEIVLLA